MTQQQRVLKKESVNQQNILASHLKPVMDRLYTLSSDLDSLKNEIKAMKGLKLAPGSIGSKVVGKSAIYVRVALPQNRHEVHEFPTDENGNLSFTAVNAVYPGKHFCQFPFPAVDHKFKTFYVKSHVLF